MEKNTRFGQLLRKHRKRANLTQEGLRLKLEDSGFAYYNTTLSMWENGRRLPDDSAVLDALAQVLRLAKEEEEALVESYVMDLLEEHLQGYVARKNNQSPAAYCRSLAQVAARRGSEGDYEAAASWHS